MRVFMTGLFIGLVAALGFLASIHYGYAKGFLGITQDDYYVAGSIVVASITYFLIFGFEREEAPKVEDSTQPTPSD